MFVVSRSFSQIPRDWGASVAESATSHLLSHIAGLKILPRYRWCRKPSRKFSDSLSDSRNLGFFIQEHASPHNDYNRSRRAVGRRGERQIGWYPLCESRSPRYGQNSWISLTSQWRAVKEEDPQMGQSQMRICYLWSIIHEFCHILEFQDAKRMLG